MEAEILGGPEDGKVLNIPDGTTAWNVAKPVKPLDWSKQVSPFEDVSIKSESWNVLNKIHHRTGKEYPVILHPGYEAWLDKHGKRWHTREG